ncbi:alanine/glycine:cation symporter family protein [Candidatus Protochlamydia phocaeensis]|uniref:alanine/glycine:cation symporter family protein n=1 Tax=Candidatus Protochlamydia phocaeensis TaxID=1414722 RepID=UPI0008391B95|nr:sodium:alanine symporter family protein [Candidatus Protochlamydia phocaeensis]
MSNLGETLLNGLDVLYSWVWGAPLLILLSGVGIYLTIALRGLQFRYLGYALKLVFSPSKDHPEAEGKGDISHFESLMTALAATIGIGNIAGVATALAVGGLGALFWMWVTALLGMATKYAEAILAVKYRVTDARGEMCGGPMYFIASGLGWRWLAVCFALFGAIAALGGGNMLQANSVADVMGRMFHINPWWSGITVAALTGLTLLGGIKSIGKVAGFLVPFMALFYIAGASVILAFNYMEIPGTLMAIVTHAFTGQAAFGGFMGSTMLLALRVGVSRGLMTSEAGLGTASIAAAAAKTDLPGRQALVSMTGSFLATIIMCSVTGLVLGVTGVFGQMDAEGKLLNGASMTVAAFESVFSGGGYVVTIGLILFAFTTLLGWAYYGEKCVEYLFGVKSVPFYRILFTLVIIPGAVLELDIVWKISDVFNGLMAFPNLIGLCALSSVVIAETHLFLNVLKAEKQAALNNEALA